MFHSLTLLVRHPLCPYIQQFPNMACLQTFLDHSGKHVAVICSQLSDCDCVMSDALQEYVLICCQHPSGGLVDKPGKSVLSLESHISIV